MKHVLAVAVAVLLPLAATATNNGSTKELDGRSFDIQLTDKDMIKGSKPITDHITFANGKLVSTYLRDELKYGLDITYTASKGTDTIAFEAKAHSRQKGDVTWNGILQTGGRRFVSGTFRWVRKGDKAMRMEFAGTDAAVSPP